MIYIIFMIQNGMIGVLTKDNKTIHLPTIEEIKIFGSLPEVVEKTNSLNKDYVQEFHYMTVSKVTLKNLVRYS